MNKETNIPENVKSILEDINSNILWNYITNLEQENEILKEQNVCVGCNNNPDYKSRIYKAIEYITSEESINTFTTIESREQWLKVNKQLLNILTGGDKE